MSAFWDWIGLSEEAKLVTRFHDHVSPAIICLQSELFQDDLYPDTASDTPAISAEEFFDGKNADPILVSCRHFHNIL